MLVGNAMSAFRYLLAIFQQEKTCITSLGILLGRFRCILEGAVALHGHADRVSDDDGGSMLHSTDEWAI